MGLHPGTSPAVSSVLRARYWTSALLRILALVFILRFVWYAGDVVVGVPASILASLNSSYGSSVDPLYPVMEFIRVLVWLIPAAFIVLTHGRIVRWLFPLPPQGCPQCNYPIAGRPLGVCPECGLVLQTDSQAASPPPGYPR